MLLSGAGMLSRAGDHRPDDAGDGRSQLIRQNRANPELVGRPVVALKADATGGMESRVREDGAGDLVPKPVEMPRLLELLRALTS